MVHVNIGSIIAGTEKSNPNLIKDGRKRVEQIAANENEKQKRKKFLKKLFKLEDER